MIRVRSEGSLIVNLHAWSWERFELFLREDNLFQGLFFGIMLALFIYNLSIFCFVRHTSYIYLVLYIAAVTVYSAVNNGFSAVYFWPDSVVFAQRSHPVFLFSTIASIILFTAGFLNLKRYYPVIFRFLMIYVAVLGVIIISIFFVPYRIVTQISLFATLFSALCITVLALISLRTTRREAVYYLLSYIFFGVGSFLLAIRAYGATRETYYEVWGMQTGAALMVLLLSLGIAEKIRTMRNEKEKALLAKQEMEKRFQILFESAHDGIIIQQHGEIVYVNRAFYRLTGYSDSDIKSIVLEKILKRNASEAVKHKAHSYQYGGKLKTSSENDIDVIVSVAEAEIGGESAQILIITDVSTLKNAEETIRSQYAEIESQYEEMAALNDELSNNHIEIMEAHEKLGREKEQLAATIKSITEAVISIDVNGRITLLNTEAERLLGMAQDEITGQDFGLLFNFSYYHNRQVFPDPAVTLLHEQRTIATDNPVYFCNRDGVEFILEVTGNPVITSAGKLSGGVIILRDITEKYKLEQEILRVRKIDSLSVLAGGIAHDFNNLLTAILGNLSIARYSTPGTEEWVDFLTRIEQAAAKATGLTQQLLTFSKGGDPVRRPESIRQLLQSDVEFMLTGSKIKGSIEIADDLMNAEVDINQFNQVIQNLIINAMQAMPDGGNLRVTAENIVSIKSLPLQPGRYIKISIIDDGVGIPGENLDKIFDPYFTTKKKGSGLGLASCYSIIKRHGGYIEVKSSQGKGSSFNIFLPATDKGLQSEPDNNPARDFNGKTVLLLDDDTAIRDVVGLMLKSLKFDYTLSSTGEEAVDIYRQRYNAGKPFDLFITDLIIPGGMRGDKVLKKIIGINPDVKGIAISGYANDPILSNFKENGFAGCLGKPFDLKTLTDIISKVLPPG